MEFRQLEHFLAVAETKSFTRGAARVHVVQSALSASVRALETDLGARLFERTSRRVELTDAGAVLVARARKVLEDAQEARDAVAGTQGGERGTVRLGFMHSIASVDLAGIVRRCAKERPLVRIEPSTHPRGSAGLVDAVADGDLDLALAARPPSPRRQVVVRDLVSEPMALVVPPDHRLAGRSGVALGDLTGEVFVDAPPGWGSRTANDALFERHGVDRQVRLEVADVDTLVELVRAGLGVALVAPSSAPRHDGVRLLTVEPGAIFTVALITPAMRPLGAAARWFAALVEDFYPLGDSAS